MRHETVGNNLGCLPLTNRNGGNARRRALPGCPSISPLTDGYFFAVFGTCLAAAALSLSFLAALDLDCFWDACFCVAFGDLSPMVLQATRPRDGVKPPGFPIV